MGADAELFVFDDNRYRDEVVPGLVRLFQTGVPDDWLAELFDRAERDAADLGWRSDLVPHLRARPTDLARHCTWLGPDLRLAGAELAPVERRDGWRPCPSASCPERQHCPLHEHTDSGLNELVNFLVAASVSARCLGRSQFVGRSWHAVMYLPLLDRLGVGPGDPVRELLLALEVRGDAIGYLFANSDGIHGWLTAEETVDLADRLSALALPAYPPTFEAMQDFRRLDRRHGGIRYHPPAGWSWDELSLSFVRTVAAIAADEGKGVLWGNGVSTW